MAKNAVANLFRNGTGWVIVLFLPPLLVRVLDKQTYGLWLLLLQLAAYITFFDSGIQLAIARYVARAEELRDCNYLARLLSSVGMLLVLASAATVLLAALASWQLTSIFREIPNFIAPSAPAGAPGYRSITCLDTAFLGSCRLLPWSAEI